MNHASIGRAWGLMALLIAAPVLSASGAEPAAPAGNGYSIDAQVIGAGNARLQGGSWSLEGTTGQLDAASLAGGNVELDGGFWAAVNNETTGDRIFQSGFE